MGKLHDALKKAEPGAARSAAAARAAPARTQSQLGGAPAAAATADVPVYVPSALRGDVEPHLVAVSEPRSHVAAQFRAVRDRVLDLAGENGWKAFVVTGGTFGDGVSVTTANLACSLAERTDLKVVVLDADLHAPRQHRLFSVDNQRGVSDYLAGGTMLEMALQRSQLPNLWILPAGRTPAQPAELLASRRMDDLVARLRRDFDIVLIDAPAADSAADAALIAPRADATLLVVRMEHTRRDTRSNPGPSS